MLLYYVKVFVFHNSVQIVVSGVLCKEMFRVRVRDGSHGVAAVRACLVSKPWLSG